MAAKRKTKKRARRGLGYPGREAANAGLICGGEPTRVTRELLDRGGYTSNGRYFGTGEKLWHFDNGTSWGYLRAPDKAAAKRLILAKCPATKWGR